MIAYVFVFRRLSPFTNLIILFFGCERIYAKTVNKVTSRVKCAQRGGGGGGFGIY